MVKSQVELLRLQGQVGYDKQHALRLHMIPGGLLHYKQGGAKKEGAATPLPLVVDRVLTYLPLLLVQYLEQQQEQVLFYFQRGGSL